MEGTGKQLSGLLALVAVLAAVWFRYLSQPSSPVGFHRRLFATHVKIAAVNW
jgi:hypothetical protein